MRDFIIDACRTLVESPEYNDFWVLSLARDNSFEEGARSLPQKRLIDRYERAGVPSPLVTQLRIGINGNLTAILQKQAPELGHIARNQGEGSDINIGSPGHSGYGHVESKLAYECTLSKWYPIIASDYSRKLANLRSSHADAGLFLVVFFVECPTLDYPAGRWIDTNKPSQARHTYVTNSGISDQFGKLLRQIGRSPSWPSHTPHDSNLHAPRDAAIMEPMASVFGTLLSPPWKIRPEQCFSKARAGVALWEYPRT